MSRGWIAYGLTVVACAAPIPGATVSDANIDARGDAHWEAPPIVTGGGGTPDTGMEHLQGVHAPDGAMPMQCVPVSGAGDGATCPVGDVVTFVGGGLDGALCCPCTAADCGNAVCCGESVCAGSASCASLHCAPLPASCGGIVDADCDDFPEDCDEPCCPCTSC